jgi:hypothetical protein
MLTYIAHLGMKIEVWLSLALTLTVMSGLMSLYVPCTSTYVLSIPVRPRKVIRATLILVRLGIKREFTISKDVILYVDIISIAIYSGYLFIRSEYYKTLSYILIIILLLF